MWQMAHVFQNKSYLLKYNKNPHKMLKQNRNVSCLPAAHLCNVDACVLDMRHRVKGPRVRTEIHIHKAFNKRGH